MKQIVLGAALLVAATLSVRADETGLASIHDWRKEGGKICMSEHFHDGAGSGDTRKAAEAKTIASWVSFTDLEYGSTWASYALSASKKMDCRQSGANKWSCTTSSRPCKPGGSEKRRAKK